ncbi:3468_t:CDS:2 [Diversispora eburnea]|uniref:3468_t:CDS:1 n=1 Tax=Diversispora eburnea TaxID=1213867 RepID=A0A9N8W1P2_9GLOM|nr:3468_t:CDS:2 [Diversispora eburnea]
MGNNASRRLMAEKKLRKKKNCGSITSTSNIYIPKESDISRSIAHNIAMNKLFGCAYSSPIEEFLTMTGKILDVGCGSGTWLIEMAHMYPKPEYFGIDLNPCSTIPYPSNIKITKGNLLNLPYDESQFDFVRMSDFVSEFTDNEWEQSIAEMIRVTKPGGWIEFCEADLTSPENAPTFSKFLKSFLECLVLRGVNGAINTKLEYLLYTTKQVDDIQCAVKSVIFGKKGGFIGTTTFDNFASWFNDVCIEMVADHMGITYDEYKKLWAIVENETIIDSVETKFYRFWAQKKRDRFE